MANIEAEERLFQILEDFVDGKDLNPLALIEKFPEDFTFSIKFEKYESSLNASAAQIIVDFQYVIYKIAALGLHGKPDVRLLTREQKQELEISFEISGGSTHVKESIDAYRKLLEIIPKKYRTLCFIATLLTICYTGTLGFLSLGLLLDYKLQNMDSKALKENLIYIREVRRELDDTREMEEAIFLYLKAEYKLLNESPDLIKIISDHNERQLTNIIGIDKRVEINGRSLSTDALRKKRQIMRKNKKRHKDKFHYT